jgi:hypothetical protein
MLLFSKLKFLSGLKMYFGSYIRNHYKYYLFHLWQLYAFINTTLSEMTNLS